MTLATLHEEIDEVTEEIALGDLVSLVIEYSGWFWKKVGERKGTKIDSFVSEYCSCPRLAKKALERILGAENMGKGKKDLSFRDGSIINYAGQTILTWLGDKGVNVHGSDIIGLPREADNYTVPSYREIRAFVKKFFFDDPRAYSRTMKWIGKTYFNAKRSR